MPNRQAQAYQAQGCLPVIPLLSCTGVTWPFSHHLVGTGPGALVQEETDSLGTE